MKKKQFYEKPSMMVVQLKHQCHILAGSQESVGVQDYKWQSEEEE